MQVAKVTRGAWSAGEGCLGDAGAGGVEDGDGYVETATETRWGQAPALARVLVEPHADRAVVHEGNLELLAGRLAVHVDPEPHTLRVLDADPVE